MLEQLLNLFFSVSPHTSLYYALYNAGAQHNQCISNDKWGSVDKAGCQLKPNSTLVLSHIAWDSNFTSFMTL